MSDGRYSAYPAYKPSGTSWMEVVPQHWELSPLKYLASFSGGGTPSKDNAAYWNGNIPWVSPKDMKDRFIDRTIDNVTVKAVQQSSTKLLEQGALLLVVRSGILQHSIPAAINRVPVTLNQDMKAVRFGAKMKAEFAQYFVVGNQRPLLLEWCKQGATVESIEQELLGSSLFPLPPLSEQTQIAAFLDHETAKIDRLIGQQQELIRLLKEKRQAVISHAVTKGLNPHAPMKDSGVEWLGQVPAHWSVVSVSYRYEVQLGKMLDSRKITGANLRSYLRVADVQWGEINIEDLPQMDFDKEAREKFKLSSGDLLVNEGGSYPGRCAIWTDKLEECYYQKALHRMRPIDFEKDITSYFYHVLHWATEQGVFVAGGNEATIEHLPADKLRSYRFAFPSVGEQRAIASFLTAKLLKIDELMAEANGAVTLLHERRTALISAAVTGKIDVRAWQPPVVVSKIETTAQDQN